MTNHGLLMFCCNALLAAGSLTAQSITRTAVAATNLTVSAQDPLTPPFNQSAIVPLGTVLQDQQSLLVNVGIAIASFHAVLPAGSDLARFDWRASGVGNAYASFQGAVLVTLNCAAPTAADLQLRVPVNFGSPTGSIDVHNDGTRELVVTTFGQPAVNTSVVFGPAGLPIRMAMSGQGFKGADVLSLEVQAVARLTAASTPYIPGCGATIAAAPTSTATLRTSVGAMPSGGLAVLVVGLGQTSIALPFGGCQLGVTPDLVLQVNLDPLGAGAIDIGVPLPVVSFAANLQAVGLDVTGPGAVTTSDALTVQVTR